MNSRDKAYQPSRRKMLKSLLIGAGAGVLSPWIRDTESAEKSTKNEIRITRLETFLVKPRWIFLKVHTDAGIVGLGEVFRFQSDYQYGG